MRDGVSRKAGWTLAVLGLSGPDGLRIRPGGGGFGVGNMLLTRGDDPGAGPGG